MSLRSKGPYVDRFAKNSSESVNALRDIFYERHGFVARPDIPDYGCDFMVEVVKDDIAKNWRFPVQLKSIEIPNLVDSGQFISYNFELSRLGYLLDHKPEVGMVVFYSLQHKTLYYDYADRIYFRLKDLHADDEWENQDSANIRIPVHNVLSKDSIPDIHRNLCSVFANFSEMYDMLAAQHNLPSIHKSATKEKDQSIQEKALKGLKEFGLAFLEDGDISILLDMISVLPTASITSDPKLSIVSGMAYHEAGMYIDAEYFLDKGLLNQEIDEELQGSAQWTKLKNDYMRGKVDRTNFTEKLKDLRETLGTNEYNLLIIDLNLAFHEIMGNHAQDELPVSFEDSFDRTKQMINNISASNKQKNFLHIMNLTNLSIFSQRANERNLFMIETLLKDVRSLPMEVRIQFVKDFDRLNSKFRQNCLAIYKEAKEEGDSFTQAEALSVLATNSLMINIESFKKRYTHSEVLEETTTATNQNINYHLTAFNCYIDANYFDRAYRQLCNALEWLYIAEFKKLKINADKRILETHLKKMEKDFQFTPYEFQSLKIIKDIQSSS